MQIAFFNKIAKKIDVLEDKTIQQQRQEIVTSLEQ